VSIMDGAQLFKSCRFDVRFGDNS